MNKIKFTIKSLLTGCVCISGLIAQAQTVITPELQWANGISSNGVLTDTRYLKTDGSHNVITAGTFDGNVDFDPGPGVYELSSTLSNVGYLSTYISKCDSAGNFLWAKKIGINTISPFASGDVQVRTLSVDKDNGDIYISGMFGDTVDFDPGPGAYTLTPEFDNDNGYFFTQTFILKLDQSGNFQWAKRMEYRIDITSSAIGNSVSEGKQIYFSGGSGGTSPHDFDPGPGTTYLPPGNDPNEIYGHLFCLNGSGNFVFAKKIAEGSTLLNYGTTSIVPDHEGNLYINGYFNGTADVDPDAGITLVSSADTLNGSYDPYAALELFLCKYNSVGVLQWVRQSMVGKSIWDGQEDYAFVQDATIDIDANNNVYMAAGFTGPVNFNKMVPYGDSTTLQSVHFPFNAHPTATAVMKYSASGAMEWIKQISGTDTANRAGFPHIAIDDDGIIYLSGEFSNTVDFDWGNNVFNVSGAYRGNYVAQYNADGSFSWAGKVAEGAGAFAYSYDMAAGQNGYVYIGGMWGGGSMDFDPTASTFLLTPISNDNVSGFVVKLKITAVDTTTPTSIPTPGSGINANVFPNPTAGILTLALNESLKHGDITIYNIAGQKVFNQNNLTGNRRHLDISHLAPGIYYLKLKDGTKAATYKLLKQ